MVMPGRRPRVAEAGPGAGCCEEVCTLDPSSLCCLCPGGSTMDSSAGGKARPEAGEDRRDSFQNLENVYLLISQQVRPEFSLCPSVGQ